MSLDRWLEPLAIEAVATASSAIPASAGAKIAEIARIAVAAPSDPKTLRAGQAVDLIAEDACLYCGCRANDADSNLVRDHTAEIYRRIHFAPECFDPWFKATFGRSPAPVKMPKH